MNTDELQEPGNLSERKRAWENLTESTAWVELMQVLQQQADSLQQDILFGPVASEGDVYAMERKKGQLEGRLSLAGTVNTIIQNIEFDLQQAIERKDYE